MEKYEQVHLGKKQIFINNFLGGVAWGIGATIGASLLVSILGIILSQLDFIPIIGAFVSKILEFIEQNPRIPR